MRFDCNNVYLWPLVYVKNTSWGLTRLHLLWPLFMYHASASVTKFFLLLIFFVYKRDSAGTAYHVLWPIGRATSMNDGSWSFCIRPFLWWFGGGAKSFFTLCGLITYRRTAHDKCWFYMPFFIYIRKGDSLFIGLLFGIIWISTSRDSSSWGIFPFVWYKSSSSKSHFVVFPFIWYFRSSSRRTFLLLPAFIFDSKDNNSKWLAVITLLWVRRVSHDRLGMGLFPLLWLFTGSSATEFVLFPFLWVFKRETTMTTIIFPLLWYFRTHTSSVTTVVFPIFWYFRSRTSLSTVVFPVFWHFRTESTLSTILFPFIWHIRTAFSRTVLVLPVVVYSGRLDGTKWILVVTLAWVRRAVEGHKHWGLFPLLWVFTGDDLAFMLVPVFWLFYKKNVYHNFLLLPFLYSARDVAKQSKAFHLWPLFGNWSSPQEKGWAVAAPLFFTMKGVDTDWRKTYFFYPIGFYLRDSVRTHGRFFPFFCFSDRHTVGRKWGWALLWIWSINRGKAMYCLLPLFYRFKSPVKSVFLSPFYFRKSTPAMGRHVMLEDTMQQQQQASAPPLQGQDPHGLMVVSNIRTEPSPSPDALSNLALEDQLGISQDQGSAPAPVPAYGSVSTSTFIDKTGQVIDSNGDAVKPPMLTGVALYNYDGSNDVPDTIPVAIGQPLQVLSLTEEWAFVQAGETKGYVPRSYVQITHASPPPVASAPRVEDVDPTFASYPVNSTSMTSSFPTSYVSGPVPAANVDPVMHAEDQHAMNIPATLTHLVPLVFYQHKVGDQFQTFLSFLYIVYVWQNIKLWMTIIPVYFELYGKRTHILMVLFVFLRSQYKAQAYWWDTTRQADLLAQQPQDGYHVTERYTTMLLPFYVNRVEYSPLFTHAFRYFFPLFGSSTSTPMPSDDPAAPPPLAHTSRYFFLWPLFSYKRDPNTHDLEVGFLSPLVYSFHSPQRNIRILRIAPLYWYKNVPGSMYRVVFPLYWNFVNERDIEDGQADAHDQPRFRERLTILLPFMVSRDAFRYTLVLGSPFLILPPYFIKYYRKRAPNNATCVAADGALLPPPPYYTGYTKLLPFYSTSLGASHDDANNTYVHTHAWWLLVILVRKFVDPAAHYTKLSVLNYISERRDELVDGVRQPVIRKRLFPLLMQRSSGHITTHRIYGISYYDHDAIQQTSKFGLFWIWSGDFALFHYSRTPSLVKHFIFLLYHRRHRFVSHDVVDPNMVQVIPHHALAGPSAPAPDQVEPIQLQQQLDQVDEATYHASEGHLTDRDRDRNRLGMVDEVSVIQLPAPTPASILSSPFLAGPAFQEAVVNMPPVLPEKISTFALLWLINPFLSLFFHERRSSSVTARMLLLFFYRRVLVSATAAGQTLFSVLWVHPMVAMFRYFRVYSHNIPAKMRTVWLFPIFWTSTMENEGRGSNTCLLWLVPGYVNLMQVYKNGLGLSRNFIFPIYFHQSSPAETFTCVLWLVPLYISLIQSYHDHAQGLRSHFVFPVYHRSTTPISRATCIMWFLHPIVSLFRSFHKDAQGDSPSKDTLWLFPVFWRIQQNGGASNYELCILWLVPRILTMYKYYDSGRGNVRHFLFPVYRHERHAESNTSVVSVLWVAHAYASLICSMRSPQLQMKWVFPLFFIKQRGEDHREVSLFWLVPGFVSMFVRSVKPGKSTTFIALLFHHATKPNKSKRTSFLWIGHGKLAVSSYYRSLVPQGDYTFYILLLYWRTRRDNLINNLVLWLVPPAGAFVRWGDSGSHVFLIYHRNDSAHKRHRYFLYFFYYRICLIQYASSSNGDSKKFWIALLLYIKSSSKGSGFGLLWVYKPKFAFISYRSRYSAEVSVFHILLMFWARVEHGHASWGLLWFFHYPLSLVYYKSDPEASRFRLFYRLVYFYTSSSDKRVEFNPFFWYRRRSSHFKWYFMGGLAGYNSKAGTKRCLYCCLC